MMPDQMWGSSGILECCDKEEVMVGDMGHFLRVLCVHCGLFEDFYKEGYEPTTVAQLAEVMGAHTECKACPGRTGTDLIFYGCLSCPKYS